MAANFIKDLTLQSANEMGPLSKREDYSSQRISVLVPALLSVFLLIIEPSTN